MSGGSLAFFARHEARLFWRERLWWLKAKRRRGLIAGWIALGVFGILHFGAAVIAAPLGDLAQAPTREGYLVLTAAGTMAFLLLMSQAIESVTRVLYARGDVELVLSSPAPAHPVFALRLAMVALAETVVALLIMGPFVNVLAWLGGARWLSAYGVVTAMGPLATAGAIAITLGLFRTIGPARTRLAAQIVAAIIGGAMVIALQVAAILGHQGLNRFAALKTESVLALAPGLDSPLWLPVRAATGDLGALAFVLLIAALALGFAIAFAAPRFTGHVIAAAGIAQRQRRVRPGLVRLRGGSPRAVLRAKELALLARDPWLLSQSLMQLLYLLPPALMLWQSYGGADNPAPLIAPVLVMAAGQLAGGLAWLAISGEDAPDLVASAPLSPRALIMAKIEAVAIAVVLPLIPLVGALALVSWQAALACLAFGAASAASATLIQLLFRTQAKRSAFRRRQTASRLSTITEALSSIAWAGAAGLAASGLWLAIVPAMMALGLLGIVKALAPKRAG